MEWDTTGVESIKVTCWSYRHNVTLLPAQFPKGISQHDFERRAHCGECKTNGPHVVTYLRPQNKGMRG